MSFGKINIKDPAYAKASLSACKNPKCGKFIDNLRGRAYVAMKSGNLVLRNYCSRQCHEAHREEVRAGASERVKAYLAKKK